MTRALAIAMAIAAATVLAAFLIPSSVVAQQRMPCAPRDVVVESLSGPEHKEKVVLRGIANGNMIEIWVNEAGSFTIILNRPEGLSCMIGTGEAMHPISEEPGPAVPPGGKS